MRLLYTALVMCLSLAGFTCLLDGCASSSGDSLTPLNDTPAGALAPPQADSALPALNLPAGLPDDRRRPWETLDKNGYVVPSSLPSHLSSALSADSEFTPGVDRFSEDGDVSNLDQASSFASGGVGAQELSHAIYRLEMGGAQAGVVSVDLNLKARGDGSLSDYWFGVSDYGSGRWLWYGPLSDGQARISLPDGDFTSDLGNLFVAVVAYNGSAFDVVGVAANPADGADVTPPPVPAAPVLTPVTGGVLLEWTPVVAADLAGYRIYYNSGAFISGSATGVKHIAFLEGNLRRIIKTSGVVFVRLTAVDISGNESDLSAHASAIALAGTALDVIVTTNVVSGLLGDSATLTATGGTSYDFDIDGDGVFDITDDLTGMAAIDTQQTGIIRPKVQASDGGSSKAMGSISLIIAAQIPPVAALAASPNQGVLWREPETLQVTLDASSSYDQDGSGLQYSFDPLGNGSFTAFGPADTFNYNYAQDGTYLAAVRVQDDDGLIAYGSALVVVRQVNGFQARNIDYFGNKGQFCSMAIVDGNPAIAMQDGATGYLMYVRATDAGGNLWGEPAVIDATAACSYMSLKVIAGHPAVSYYVSGPFEVRYIRAADPQGFSWSNPPVTIESPLIVNGTSLADLNGNPAVAYAHTGTNELRYRRATSAAATGDAPLDWGDPPFSVDNSGNIGGYPSLATISGNAAVAYWDGASSEALYKRAVTPTGAASGDWPVLPARASPGGVMTNGHISLLEVNGRPAVCFHEFAIGSLQYVRALDADGSITADWPLVSVQVATGGNSGEYNSMAMIDGRPCISYIASAPWIALYFSRARDVDGSAFEPRVTVHSSPAEAAGYYSSLVEINRLPAICYWNLGFNNIGFATPRFN